MGKATKIQFDREGTINAVRKIPNTDEIISSVTYQKGTMSIKHNGFNSTIYNVDEVIMNIKPLDAYMSEVTFAIKSDDGGTQKLDVKLYGMLTEHVILNYDGEKDDAPKKVQKFKING